MQCSHAESKRLNMSSAMVLTNLNTIDTLSGTAKQTKKQILLNLKLRKANHTCTLLSAQTATAIIRQTQICVSSRSTDSIMNGITRNNKNFVKTEEPQFAQL